MMATAEERTSFLFVDVRHFNVDSGWSRSCLKWLHRFKIPPNVVRSVIRFLHGKGRPSVISDALLQRTEEAIRALGHYLGGKSFYDDDEIKEVEKWFRQQFVPTVPELSGLKDSVARHPEVDSRRVKNGSRFWNERGRDMLGKSGHSSRVETEGNECLGRKKGSNGGFRDDL
ncbi:hypothetical protein TNCV_908531 [Trichonephila clavipes]|nr:hypothetical protein TNCV_908531 [Trichonephila clavipes]